MLLHNLSMAMRQLTKYKLQTLLSLVGLAVGFTCFALSSLWWRYETTYDSFHPGAENLYVGMLSMNNRTEVLVNQRVNIPRLAMEQIPEVEMANATWNDGIKWANGQEIRVKRTDSTFFQLFKPQLLAGQYPPFRPDSYEMVITDRIAKKLFGTVECIGQEVALKSDNELEQSYPDTRENYRIAAVVKEWGKHTHISFEVLIPFTAQQLIVTDAGQGFGYWTTFRLHPQANVDSVSAKINKLVSLERMLPFEGWVSPLVSLHTDYPTFHSMSFVKIGHIRIFALLGALVIACAVFNYLSLYVIRIRMRARELALRFVCGSSRKQLLTMLATEFLLLILAAWVFGLLFLQATLPKFQEITRIGEAQSFFFWEMFLYLLMVTAVTIPFMLGVTWWVQRQSLNSILHKGAKAETPFARHLFRNCSLLVQLSVSMGLILATSVIGLQLHYLRNSTDIGFDHKNKAYLAVDKEYNLAEKFYQFLKSHPDVDTVMRDCRLVYAGDLKVNMQMFAGQEGIWMTQTEVSREECDFWGLQLIAGDWMDPHANTAMLNETAVKVLGLENPIDTVLRFGSKVTGVVRNLAANSLTVPQEAVIYLPKRIVLDDKEPWERFVFSYHPGSWPTVRSALNDFFQREEKSLPHIVNIDEDFNQLLHSEDTLLGLFYVMTAVCILIALFGVYSLITISCEQRRKEIAVRKVFGAKVGDILRLFFGEQLVVLLLAALVGFPVAYVCVKPWLEGYIHQVEIPLWLCPAIFVGVALLVSLCIGWRVWRTANTHPADEICKG